MFEGLKHKRRIDDLEERFEKLARDFNALKLDWADTLDKLTRIAGRISKRAALSQEKEDALMGLPQDDPNQLGLPLSPRQELMNRQILARRNRTAAANGGR